MNDEERIIISEEEYQRESKRIKRNSMRSLLAAVLVPVIPCLIYGSLQQPPRETDLVKDYMKSKNTLVEVVEVRERLNKTDFYKKAETLSLIGFDLKKADSAIKFLEGEVKSFEGKDEIKDYLKESSGFHTRREWSSGIGAFLAVFGALSCSMYYGRKKYELNRNEIENKE